MNIGEANAANVLMRAALGEDTDVDRIRDAGRLLAKGAHRALMAGFTPDSWVTALATRQGTAIPPVLDTTDECPSCGVCSDCRAGCLGDAVDHYDDDPPMVELGREGKAALG